MELDSFFRNGTHDLCVTFYYLTQIDEKMTKWYSKSRLWNDLKSVYQVLQATHAKHTPLMFKIKN